MAYQLTVSRPGVAFVVGGSGGAGAGIACALAASGVDVAVSYNSNATKAENLQKDLVDTDIDCSFWKLDLMRQQSVEDVVMGVAERHGGINTLIYAAGPRFELVRKTTSEQWAGLKRSIPLGRRLGRKEELAAAVMFLASNQASFVRGQFIVGDGGQSV